MRLKWMALSLCAVALTACGDAGLKTKEASDGVVGPVDGPGPFRALVIDNGGEVVSVWYEKEGDLAVAQDDMILGTHADIQAGNVALLQALLAESGGGGEKDAAKRKAAIEARQGILGLGEKTRWPGGILIYDLDSSLPAATVTKVKAAAATINGLSILTVREKLMPDTGPTLKIVADTDPNNCDARQGYQNGGGMTMRLGANCPEWTVVHEFLHSAGLAHEQGRSDRTTYMTIDVSNIKPGKQLNYAEWKAGSYYNTLYDLCSVMHYSPKIPPAWSVNGSGGTWMTLTNDGKTALNTCSVALPSTCGSQAPGQRCAISRGDKATLDAMY